MAGLREALEDAYEKVEDEEQEEVGGSGEEDPEESIRAAGEGEGEGEASGESQGEEQEGEIEEKDDETTAASEEGDKDGESEQEEKDTKEGEAETSVAKAPAGWSAKVREQWGKIPKDVQAEIIRRESSYASGIQKYAEAGKFGEAVKQTMAPYQHIMQMEGADEITAVKGFLNQAATMRMGTPEQKAEMVSKFITTYGVDVGMLDNMLVGEPVMTPEQKAIQDMLDQRLSPVEKLLQQANQSQQYAQQQTLNTVDNEIVAFEQDPANEFIGDVKEDMADILEMAANRGQKVTLQEAYDKAVRMSPELSEIVQARANTKKVEEAKALSEKKKAASVSAAGGVGGGAGKAKPVDRRSAIMDAWSEHEQA